MEFLMRAIFGAASLRSGMPFDLIVACEVLYCMEATVKVGSLTISCPMDSFYL